MLRRRRQGRRVMREKPPAIRTTSAPAPGGHYSQAIVRGDHIYVSGSGPFDVTTHQVVGRDIAEQTRQTLRNIGAILKAAGSSFADIVKVTVYLRNMRDFQGMDRAYRTYFPRHPPARTTVQAGLYGKGRLITIDAIAVKPPA